jgi:dodecin
MSDNVYAISEIAGTSETSIEDAVQGAITTASRKLKNLDWFEVGEIRGHIRDGKVAHYQVVLKIGFRYES